MSLTPAEREQLLASRAVLHRNRDGLAEDLRLGEAAADDLRDALPDLDPVTIGRVTNIVAACAGLVGGDLHGQVPTVLLFAALDLVGPELGPPPD